VREQKINFRYYLDASNAVLFLECTGVILGGSVYRALLAVARQARKDELARVRTVFLDLRDVVSTDLSNSDRAFLEFMARAISKVGGASLVDADFVWLVDEGNPVTPTLVDRQQRIGNSAASVSRSSLSRDYASALDDLGLPATYEPLYLPLVMH